MRVSWKDATLSILIHLRNEALEDLRLSVADRIAHEKFWTDGEYETYVAILTAIMREMKARGAGE